MEGSMKLRLVVLSAGLALGGLWLFGPALVKEPASSQGKQKQPYHTGERKTAGENPPSCP